MATPQRQEKTASEVRNWSHDFSGKLADNELLTGTPTITEGTSTLTLANKAVNTEELTILGKKVRIGKALQVNITGGSANTEYTIVFQCGTDASPAQTVIDSVKLLVTADS